MKLAKLFIVHTFLLIFAFTVSAQDYTENNKANDLTFLIEKLRNLKLLVSTEKDVRKAFGKSCQTYCYYKNQWVINVEYVRKVWSIADYTTGKAIIYKPRSNNFLGKLLRISIVQHGNTSLPDSFISSGNLKCVKNVTFPGGNETFKTRLCSDNQGLVYFVLDEITVDGKIYKDILRYIHLTLPEEKYNEFFVIDKQ